MDAWNKWMIETEFNVALNPNKHHLILDSVVIWFIRLLWRLHRCKKGPTKNNYKRCPLMELNWDTFPSPFNRNRLLLMKLMMMTLWWQHLTEENRKKERGLWWIKEWSSSVHRLMMPNQFTTPWATASQYNRNLFTGSQFATHHNKGSQTTGRIARYKRHYNIYSTTGEHSRPKG